MTKDQKMVAMQDRIGHQVIDLFDVLKYVKEVNADESYLEYNHILYQIVDNWDFSKHLLENQSSYLINRIYEI